MKLIQTLIKDNEPTIQKKASMNMVERFENHRSLNIFLGLLIVIYIGITYHQNGFSLNLDIVSWTFLSLGLLLASSPIHFISLINTAAGTVGSIIFSIPFTQELWGLWRRQALCR